jgi:RNA polymerase sigma factor (sigma-70 family)
MGETASGTPLTPEQQDRVVEAEPTIKRLTGELQRKFPRACGEDIAQSLRAAYAEVVPGYDPTRGPSFDAYAYWPVWGKVHDELTREARQSPRHMARKAFGQVAEPLEVATGAYMEDGEILAPIIAACREGTFRMFFGATLDTWRAQGEQRLVDHLARLKAFRALQSAFATLTPDEWKLLELYYIECLTWEEVGKAFDISDRQAKRRDAQIRQKLKDELIARGVDGAPPVAA